MKNNNIFTFLNQFINRLIQQKLLTFVVLIVGIISFFIVNLWLYNQNYKSQINTNFINEILNFRPNNNQYLYRILPYFPSDNNNDRFDVFSQIPYEYQNHNDLPFLNNSFRYGTLDTFKLEDNLTIDEYKYIWFADKKFIDYVEIQFIKGNKNEVFENENSIIISDKYAFEHFGDLECIGKSLTLYGNDFKVSGVFREVPNFYHFKFHILFNIEKAIKISKNQNVEFKSFSYFLYDNIENFSDFNDKYNQYYSNVFSENYSQKWIVPIWQNHTFNASTGSEVKERFFYEVIDYFSIIILLFCILNLYVRTYSNLSLRIKEFGLIYLYSASYFEIFRKIIKELIKFSINTLIFSNLFLTILLPFTNSLNINNYIDFVYLSYLNCFILLILIVFSILISLFFTAKLKQTNLSYLFKNTIKVGINGSFYRHIILILQFSISLSFLIIMTGTNAQFEFLGNNKLSYSNTNLIITKNVKFSNNINKNCKIQNLTKNEIFVILQKKGYSESIKEFNQLYPDSKYLSIISFGNKNIPKIIKPIENKLDTLIIIDKSLEIAYQKHKTKLAFINTIIVLIMLNIIIGLVINIKFILNQRNKELMIRKICGASNIELTKILVIEVLSLLFIGIIISWIISFLQLNTFFNSFIDNVSVQISFFVNNTIILILVTLITSIIYINMNIKKIPIKLIK